MKKIFYSLLLISSIVVASCAGKGQNKDTKTNTEKAEPIHIMKLDYQSISRSIETTATLLAFEEIHLAPASPGRIDHILVEIGSRVKKGDLLVQMDKTQLHQAEVQLKTVETDFKRLDTLRKTGSISLQQYDQLKSQYEIAQSNVDFLSDNIRLKAPFNGVISGKYFESGELYSGAPLPSIGKAAIVSLVQIDRLKILVPVSEAYYPLISKDMEVKVFSDLYPEKTFTAKIFNIYPTLDPISRSFNVELALNNADGLLRPGMFARININFDNVEGLLLPSVAVLKLQGSNDRYLFIEENGLAKRISVTVGNRYNDKVEVISDKLKPGDHVITTGQARLLDGMKVEVIQNQL